jgi:hypothetical protein
MKAAMHAGESPLQIEEVSGEKQRKYDDQKAGEA